MGAPEPDADSTSEVVATGAVSLKLLRAQLVLWSLMLLGSGWLAVSGREPLHVAQAILAATALGFFVWANVSNPRMRLVLVGETMELRRRFRPLSVARRDVIAVRGNIPGRPTWSEQVLIETRESTVRLPQLDRTPGELILRLQEWAEVGEEPPT